MAFAAPTKHTALFPLFTVSGIAALFFPSDGVRLVFTAIFIVGIGVLLGNALFSKELWPWRTFLGTLTAIALLIVLGTAMYYAYQLNAPASALVIVATGGVAFIWTLMSGRRKIVLFGAPQKEKTVSEPVPWKLNLPQDFVGIIGAIASIIAITLVWYAFSLLAGVATDMAMRSPWDVVPRMFFPIFFLAAVCLLAATTGNFGARLSLPSAMALALLAVGVAAVVYKVGFGFDPFIHLATEQQIFRDGAVMPKPLYYVGHYALVILMARMTGGHLSAINTWVVPAAFALIIPVAYWSLRRALAFPATAAAVAAVGVLLLPLSSLVAPTPQGLANALFLMTVFLALPVVAGNDSFPKTALILFALSVGCVHPIAGIPLVIFVALVLFLTAFNREKGWHEAARWTLVGVVALAGAVALPALFMLNAAISGSGVVLDAESLRTPGAIIEALETTDVATRQFNAAYDFTYSWQAWRAAVIALAAAAGLLFAWRRTRGGTAYIIAAGVFMANYVLLKSVIKFPFLISYEQSNYGDRLFELTLFVLAPIAAVALAALINRAMSRSSAARIALFLTLAGLITSSVYLAYPRRDSYENSRGWSTSAADVEAVRAIDKDAAGKPYVVLANQSVSAAAVREFGFKNYYVAQLPAGTQTGAAPSEQLFFYPIPTGNALYSIFLEANATFGKRKTIERAMDLTGTDTVYYVVSYYWWNARRIVVGAGKDADKHWSVNDKDWVFKYVRKK